MVPDDLQDDTLTEEALSIDGMGIVDEDNIDPDAIDPIDGIAEIDVVDVIEPTVFDNELLLADEAPTELLEEETDDFKEMADYMYGNYEER